MAFSNEVFRKVGSEFAIKRERAELDAERRRKHVEQAVQGIKGIHDELHDVYLTSLYAAISGGNVRKKLDEVEHCAAELQKKKRQLLTAAGYPADYTNVRYECEKCRDVGYDCSGNMCSCFKKALAVAQLDVSGLGALAKTQSFENFNLNYYPKSECEKIAGYVEQLRAYADCFRGENEASWILTGAAGLGKTHLTTATAVEIIQRGFDVLYMTSIDFFATFEKQRFGNGQKGDGSTERFYDAELLIIDDLGTETSNNYTVSCFFSVVDKRIIKGLPTIINSNLSGHELKQQYGDRTASRIFGHYNALKFDGRDIRLQKLKEGCEE